MRRLARWAFLVAVAGGLVLAAEPQSEAPSQGPRSPRDEQATFRVLPGFRVELVASEPDVVDPVAMAFDEQGRIYVAEMRAYPNAGVATGVITSGQVKRLEDRDGDGVYETSTVFADGLRLPTAVMPWGKGVLIANAPELIYCEDTDGDGRADKRRTLYTGFALANIQQLLNSLQWGLDNWVYGVAGNNGGTIRSAEKPDWPEVVLRARGVRLHPDAPGSLEPTSGGGQYGLAPDEWQQWFTATNSQHLRHVVLPEQYLRRNPALVVSAVTLDIPDHGAACKVERISAFEAWRVERTRRRKEGSDSKRFAPTELVPGGFITSACSPVVYLADLFPAEYRGNTFVCDPANNLIHRDVLVPNGATFTAKRADSGCEFLASTDNWFRPVHLTLGPDGALYVLDFYREAIETPLSLPDDIKAKLNLESRNRGRIWRIVPNGTKPAKKPNLRQAPAADLVPHLANANLWWRLNAQRLLVERQDTTVVPAVRQLAQKSESAPGRAHALWTLDGLKALTDADVEQALRDDTAGVREQALRLAEGRLAKSAALLRTAAALAEDSSPRVRFQAACSLGESDEPVAVAALAKVLRRDLGDPWTQTAALSSTARTAPQLLETLVRDAELVRGGPGLALLTRLAALAAARPGDADLSRALAVLALDDLPQPVQLALLEGLGQGLQNSSRPLNRLWDAPPPALQGAVGRARPFFERAATTAADEKRSVVERAAAIRLLGFGPFAVASAALPGLLTARQPGEVQLAAVRALSQHDQPKVAELLLASWASHSPTLRREVLEAVFARPGRLAQLLTAIERKQVLPGQLEPFRVAQLRKHPDAKLRERATKLLADAGVSDRAKVVESYRDALDLAADAGRGKAVFKKNCATCHRLENEGNEVGADLLAALRNKSREALLIDILDPSREVDPRYLNYVVTTQAGRIFTGMLAAETASGITLRRAEKAEDAILRHQIDTIEATTKSLMPEGLETQLSRQDVADVIAYLLKVVTK